MSAAGGKFLSSGGQPSVKLTGRACNDPQRMRARRVEAEILTKMPPDIWLSCTAVSRLVRALDDRKIRARLDRLARDGSIECKREQSIRGPVYLFRKLS